jgi:DNA-binding transcriptional regulator YhcF (GntR family)
MSRRASENRKPKVHNYPPLLRRETLDAQHAEILAYIGQFHERQRMAPTMREIARSLRHSIEWMRVALGRLEKAGLVVCPKGPGGVIMPRSIRLADSAEYAEGMTSRWIDWLAELPENERAHLILAVQESARRNGSHVDLGEALAADSSPTLEACS